MHLRIGVNEGGVGEAFAACGYNEPKKLVAHGMAAAAKDRVGRRPRTVYTITERGRESLAEWLKTPGVGPSLEYEQLIKIFFADHGSRDDALATIEASRA
jgi:PadR family transcriptional regulator, regulatory protein AphA